MLKLTSTPSNQVPVHLLLEADPSETKIRTYLEDSTCFTAVDNDQTLGACVLSPLSPDIWELMNIAVDPACQGKGVGTQLLDYVIQAMQTLGARRIELGTGSFGHQLTYYQRAGFRVYKVERDFFLKNYDQPIFENSLQHKDMLRLSIEF